MCRDCFSGKRKKPGPYVSKLLMFRSLYAAGFPKKRNDLTIDEWLDMNRIEETFIQIFKNKK